MKREAFKAVGNPLLMGGPVLFVRGDGAPRVPDDDIQAIVEGRGFVFDPSDLSTLTDSAGTKPMVSPGLVGRIDGKWGAGNETLSLQSPFPSLTTGSDLSFLNGLGFANFNFRGGDAYCVTLGFRVPDLGSSGTLLYRRERASANETLDVIMNPDGSLSILIAGADQQRANAVTILTPDRVTAGKFFSITVLADFTANTAEVWLNGVSQGTGTFASPAGPAVSLTQTWVVLYSIPETLFRRVIEYAGLPTTEERELFEEWVTQAGLPPAFDPLQLFAAGGGVGTGVLLDTKLSRMFSDAGITPAGIGDAVYRIVDRVAGAFLDQAVATQRGVLRDNGIQMDGVDDVYPAGFSMAAGRTVFAFGVLGPTMSGSLFTQRNSGGVNFTSTFLTSGLPEVTSGGVVWGVTGGSDARSKQSSLAVRVTGTKGEVFQNGVLIHTEDPVNGSFGSTGPSFFSQVVGTLVGGMIINRPLTDAEIAKVDAYWRLPPTPEDELVDFFATKRLGYVIDPRDQSTMLRDGSIPVTADGQALFLAEPRLGTTIIDFRQTTAANQPIWDAGAIVPDGVDDSLFFPTGGTAVQPDFGNLAGFVASLLVTPGPLQLQTFWTVGFGGTAANFRLRINGRADGSVLFSVHDGVARRDFVTPVGMLVPDVPVLLTLFVDFQTREAKGFVDGVERASFTLLNVADIVNVDNNRCCLFRAHSSTIELSNSTLHRAAFLHDRTDAAGRITMENWVKEAP